MNRDTLNNIFKAPYQSNVWKGFLKELFRNLDSNYFQTPVDLKDDSLVKHKDVEHIWEFGDISLADDKLIKFYEVELKAQQQVTKNRVGLRNIISSEIGSGYIDGAIITYYNPESSDWRFTFISKDLYWDEDNNEVKTETHPKRYTYLLGQNETVKTAVDQFEWLFKTIQTHDIEIEHILKAFSVEKLSKEFYDGYFHQYKTFVAYIVDNKKAFAHFISKANGSHDKAEKLVSDFTKKFLGRIVFLYFLQKKGWMGVPNDKEWGEGQLDFLFRLFEELPDKNNFYQNALTPLFFNTLNSDRSANNDIFSVTNTRIPYLNGGLFEKDDTEPVNIQFEPQRFIDLFAFFSKYNFTVDESSPDDQDIGVDPEMLGHIFENLLEDNKDKGAFYTPKEIVHYMTQESLIEYLHTHLPNSNKEALTIFVKQKQQGTLNETELEEIDLLLSKVKILDPAIGSGAFPMGLLHEIFALKGLIAFEKGYQAWSPARVKERIIENSIYGVDIEEGAVDIARLRFWLSLVVDEPTPRPLPNLDYKIICGNSLISRYGLDISINEVFKQFNKGRSDDDKIDLDKYKALVNDYLHEANHDKKEEFKQLIEEVKSAFKTYFSDNELKKLRDKQGELYLYEGENLFGNTKNAAEKRRIKKLKTEITKLEKEKKEREEAKIYINAVEWRFEFPNLLDADGNFEGFDIVIGNPPWGAKMDSNLLQAVKKRNKDVIKRMTDSFMFFINESIKISKPNGSIVKIIPEVILTQQDNEPLRKKIIKECQIKNIINLGDGIFNGVTRASCILQLKKEANPVFNYIAGNFRKINGKVRFLETYKQVNSIILKSLPYNIFPSKNIDLYKTFNKINGTIKLIDIIDKDGIQRGVSPDFKDAFIVTSETINNKNLEKDYIKATVTGGKDVKKYIYNTNDKHIIYTTRNTLKSLIPNISKYISQFESNITCKEVKEGKHPIYSLHRPRKECIFNKNSKLMGVITGDSLIISLDVNKIYPTDGIYVFSTSSLEKDKVLMVLLNSKIASIIYKLFSNEGGKTLAQIKPNILDNYPVPSDIFRYTKIFSTLADYLVLLKKSILNINQFVPNSHISETFEELIDAMVFELYFPEEFAEADIHFIKYAERDFISIEGKPDAEQQEIIHAAYQKLREKDNEIRNNLQLMDIRLRDLIMPIKSV